MKVFISADIEGTAGIAHWDEAARTHPAYAQFQELMTAEVVAACEGARAAGAEEVLIKDAHSSARNVIVDRLPGYARIIRGWPGHPDLMMFGLDADFAAAIYTGYHGKAGSELNPLAHTLTMQIHGLTLNGALASELTLNALCAAGYGVPSAFVSGDADICADAEAMVPGIATVATLKGAGHSAESMAPERARELIRSGVERVLGQDMSAMMPATADRYEMIIEFNNPSDAYKASWYPGAKAHGRRAVAFEAAEFFDIQRAIRFICL
ncbi:M55 family metallopeptidase [Acidimangrovimonas sediminis]|uniref:M55 family metallopeptidase n=1 Tax=Acidimangrovimonas sediminis TaxID=2056283 RepID=UPI000C80E787|nr:M55 family metallopeptidase [Acidimangrovimonas sediminis]